MSIVPFPRRGLTVRETFARHHRDPAQWGVFAAAAGAAVVAGACAGSFWTAVWAYSIGGAGGIVVRALIGVRGASEREMYVRVRPGQYAGNLRIMVLTWCRNPTPFAAWGTGRLASVADARFRGDAIQLYRRHPQAGWARPRGRSASRPAAPAAGRIGAPTEGV